MKVLIIISFIGLWLSQMSCQNNEITEQTTTVIKYYTAEDSIKFNPYQSGPEEFGYATALVNGEEWRASAIFYQSVIRGDTLFPFGFTTCETDFCLPRQSLSFSFIHPYKEGSWNIISDLNINRYEQIGINELVCKGGFDEDDGDVSGASYQLDTLAPSHFDITEWDVNTNILKGNFEVVIRLDHAHSPENYPNVIQFEDGYFECKFPF